MEDGRGQQRTAEALATKRKPNLRNYCQNGGGRKRGGDEVSDKGAYLFESSLCTRPHTAGSYSLSLIRCFQRFPSHPSQPNPLTAFEQLSPYKQKHFNVVTTKSKLEQ